MKVAVIFGGKSPEHEVSRNSAVNVIKWLEGGRYDIVKVGITKQGRWYVTEADYDEIASGAWENRKDNLQAVIPHDPVVQGILVFDSEDRAKTVHIDCMIPVLHGTHGEDGDIQGLFELAEIPYVGSGVAASANCMDKSITKQLVRNTGVTMAKWYVVHQREYNIDADEELKKALAYHEGKFPLFVKPSSAGSSVGATKVLRKEDFRAAVEDALKYDSKVMVEELIKGREFEVAVIGNLEPKATCVGEILSAGEFYDYDAKYNNPASQTKVVDDLPEETTDRVRSYAVEIYKALDCRGLCRVDFFYANDGTIVFNEANTLPGFTKISMYPKLWESMGIDPPVLLDSLIKLAMENHAEWVKK